MNRIFIFTKIYFYKNKFLLSIQFYEELIKNVITKSYNNTIENVSIQYLIIKDNLDTIKNFIQHLFIYKLYTHLADISHILYKIIPYYFDKNLIKIYIIMMIINHI